ncbi:hypothetical protein [Paraliomyxa miuraensis]|uniref:hypothetical protein n=1 Tax=Paraliomyxa miuraensis TaxID=376150 RepID=UPI002256EF33|nr:hypothetical protein [Paraliomyxa miuraensis]MCX4239498.1 hypothetical protein [Paraliomyxa miuraensis]
MSKPRNPSFLVLGALGLCLCAGACKDDPPTPKLFQEEGVWSVIKYALEGGELRDVDNANRRDAFMLSFDASEKVVTSAACIERETDTAANSPCLLTPDTTHWDCRCFAYDFANDEMFWREFNAGDIPPSVSLSEANGAGDGGGTATDGGGGDGGDTDTYIIVAEIMDIASTYNFRPLPEDLFGSDGVTSRFVLQKRADSVFARAYEDPDGRPACQPCVP